MILPMSINLSEVEILKIEHNRQINEVSASVFLISSQSFLIHSFQKEKSSVTDILKGIIDESLDNNEEFDSLLLINDQIELFELEV